MSAVLFRCSSIGRLMTEPKTKAEGPLSVGAKTCVRELALQEIYGIDFEFSSKETEKGIQTEQEAIDLLNRVRGLALSKNQERKTVGFLTGSCDLFDAVHHRGHDLKSAWSAKTFRGWQVDCEDKLYEWQMRGYMLLWDAVEWEVNYTLVNTPEHLIGYEPITMHIVDHIPEHQRLTTWSIKRDAVKEEAMLTKLQHAHEYYLQCIDEFDKQHPRFS